METFYETIKLCLTGIEDPDCAAGSYRAGPQQDRIFNGRGICEYFEKVKGLVLWWR